MSLTSLIKGKSQQAKRIQMILREVIPSKDEFYTLSGHDAFTSTYTARVPYTLTNSYHSAVVGTAFDYMARLIIAQRISTRSEEVWVDSASKKGLTSVQKRLPENLRRKLVMKYEKGQVLAKDFVILNRHLSDELLRHSAYIARLEHVFRSGVLPKNIEESLLNEEENEIVNELKEMCEVFESEFMNPNIIHSQSDVVFNPYFGKGSIACGGADADIFIDGVLYDFKTTKDIGYKWQDIAQVFGYYFLDEIAKKTKDLDASLVNQEIKRLAFYKARYGEFEIIDLDIINQNNLKQARDKIASILNIDLTKPYPIKRSERRTVNQEIKMKKDVIRLENKMNLIKQSTNQFSEYNFNQQIQEQWRKLKEVLAKENLKKMPIDTISTLERGMPINALMDQGIRTIYDATDRGYYDLIELKGVGVKSAEAITNAVSQIKRSVYEQAAPHINPDNLSKEEIKLLESIYKKRDLVQNVESLQYDLEKYTEEIGPSLEIAKERKGLIGSLFQSKQKKEQINAAYHELNKHEYASAFRKMNENLTQILEFSVDQGELIQHFIEKNASIYTEIEKVTGFKHGKVAEGLPTEIVEEVNNFSLNTTHLKVKLRAYQTFGAKYGLYFKRTLLGDEMGLGKTIQALAMINHLFENNQTYAIVVCPLSILANWKREVQQHSNLNVFVFHGHNRDKEFAKWQAQTGILLTTYEHTLRMDLNELQELNVLIVDEAHYVKNPEAKRSQAVYELAAMTEYVLFMSGTPLENRLEEMKQLITVLQENIADQLSQELHLLQPTEFKKTVAAVYLRRNRKDVLAELPELEVIPQWTHFGKEEKHIYDEATQAGLLMTMRRAAWMGGSPGKSPKLEKLLNICEEAHENGHKVLVFSFFRDVIRTIHHHLEGKTFEPITGDVPNTRRQDIIDEFSEAKSGSVLISQITAGGVGLNIQAANIVILCEPQWKPSTEEQAISRAYRMGQSRNVIVYRLLTEDSIDVSMLEILGEKANLFDLYARESQVASLSLSQEKENEEGSVKQKVLKIEKERLRQEVS